MLPRSSTLLYTTLYSTAAQISKRAFSTTPLAGAKVLRYREFGSVENVLKLEEEAVGEPSDNQVLVKMLAAPINPADINMIQGVYGIKPKLPAIGGNEGVGVVEKVGKNVKKLQKGDRVIPANPGFGTWRTQALAEESALLKVSSDIPVEYAATIGVNPCTAYRLLKDFVDLKPGDVIVQNGANSMVGQTVFQLARERGIKTINIIRDRRNHGEVVERMKAHGANIVVTEDYVLTPKFKELISDLPAPRLALNAVGGKSATNLARVLGQGGVMVTYGGMSHKPVQIPTSLFIFKDIHLTGFWLSRWVEKHSAEERAAMVSELSKLISADKLRLWVETHKFSRYDLAFAANEQQRDRKVVLKLDE